MQQNNSEWDDLVAGKNCGFCAPCEDRHAFGLKIKDLSVSRLDLQREQNYKGYCILIFKKRHVTGLEQLSDDEYQAYMSDLRLAMTAIYKAVQPDHMNYATLGNAIPHLHYHIIPRYKDDPNWRTSVWNSSLLGKGDKVLSEDECDLLASEIEKYL